MQDTKITEIQRLFTELMEASHNRIIGYVNHLSSTELKTQAAIALKSNYRIQHAEAVWLGATLVEYAERLATPASPIDSVVEAVQIEWISNGILVRGKSADGAFCNYYRDTSQFISQSVGGKAIQFVNNKAPKVGDTCILYFGMSESASE